MWLARFDADNPRSASSVVQFLSITDCSAEPIGIYFTPSGRSLFVNVQHRGGDGNDGAFAIQRIAGVDLLASGLVAGR